MSGRAREPADLLVVGGGVSGVSLAWQAARDGRRVRLLEQGERLGGCIHSERPAALPGFWFELGAHTAYNSYGGFLALIEGGGLAGQLLARGPARARFGWLRAGVYRWLTPLRVLFQLDWLEALAHLPRGLFRSRRGRTLAEQMGGLVGPGNYQRVLRPFLSAVPSQAPDQFPAEGPGSLFKKRPRREDRLRSYGLPGGLQAACEAAARAPGISVEMGATVRSVRRDGAGFLVELASGDELHAPQAAIAAPLEVARALVRESFPALAQALAAMATAAVDSVGVVLPRGRCWMPEHAFLVPAEDSFFSCVTRDPFPDPELRAFTFHFRPGLTRAARLERVCAVLRVEPSELLHLAEKQLTLPAPVREHAAQVAAIDAALGEAPGLALTGNYFGGLAIEDCVQRSIAEWARLQRRGKANSSAS